MVAQGQRQSPPTPKPVHSNFSRHLGPLPLLLNLGFHRERGGGAMESLVPELTRLLADTLNPDQSLVESATDALDRLSVLPQFPASLLAIAAGGESQGVRISAAAYLKNLTRRYVLGSPYPVEIHVEFRNQLAQFLIQAEPAVLKVLVEAFRVIILNDFVKKNSWPELVPELRSVIQSSSLISQNARSQWNTVNSLTVLQTICRPFQYFLNPKVPKEPVPPQLELIAQEILLPLQTTFHHFTDKALSLQGGVENESEQSMLVICKCMYFAVRSYMPSALIPILPSLCWDMFRILDSLNLDSAVPLLRLKIAKRSLIFFSSLVTRHRKYADKLLPNITSCATKIAKQSIYLSRLNCLSDRIISLAFDLISHILETGPGWRLVSPHFSTLLDSAIFPALALNQKDISEWEDDTDEYVRKNFPSDLDDISGWAEDLFTARKSAINLLGVISISKGPPVVSSASKRKKADKYKRKEREVFVGEFLVVPFLSNFPMPSNLGDASSKMLHDYYGVLLAYGGLQDFLRERNPEYTTILVRNRVLPLYTLSPCSPYLIAAANWVLGQLAPYLLEDMNADIYGSLLKALTMADVGDINCYPVHASSAGAIAVLLENEYVPHDWLSVLQVLGSKMGSGDESESSLLFQLLGAVVESGGEKVAVHIPQITSSIAGGILELLPPIPEPWPQVIERGFTALAAAGQTWEDSMPENLEQNESKHWQSGWNAIARTFSSLLQHAWLMPAQSTELGLSNTLPPSSCLDDASALLGFILRSITKIDEVISLKIPELLAVWASLIADWNSWDELEDMSIFTSIREAVNLHKRCDFTSFFVLRMPSQNPLLGSPPSIIGNISSFVSEAIAAYPSATWRACSCVHALLHIPSFSPEMDAVRQLMTVSFTSSSFSRFKDVRDKPLGLWKPLLLAIASCYICYPENIEQVLEKNEVNGFFVWARGLAYISTRSFEPGLSSESEIKLAVMALAKVIERLLWSPSDGSNEVLRDCFVSLMEAFIHLKEVQQEEDGTDVDDEDLDEEVIDGDSEDDDDDDEDSEDDEHEETHEEFLERYAKAAEELQNEIVEEGDVEEEVLELELGALEDVDIENEVVVSLIQRHHQSLVPLAQSLSESILQGIKDTLPEYGSLFGVLY